MTPASLSGPSAHEFVTLQFVFAPPATREQEPPRAIEVRASLPLPSVGDTVTIRDEQGRPSRFEVRERDLRYRDDSRCVVTLSVAPPPGFLAG